MNRTKKNPPSYENGFFFGGQGWIRTIEVTDGRFTVCSLWPLGNLPIFICYWWSWWTDENTLCVFSVLGQRPAHFATKNNPADCFLDVAHPLRVRVRSNSVLLVELVDGLEPPTC